MEAKVVKQDKDMVLIELKGDSIGFANLLREELWNHKETEEAASMKDHPYMAEPKLYLKTKGEKPKKVLLDAAKSLKTKVMEIKKEFDMETKK